MRKTIAAVAGVAMLATSGCGAMRDSLRYPGGVVGRTLDERTFDASQSKQLALLRATLALAIAARIGEGSVETEDADVFARQLAEAANEINYAAVDAGYRYFPRDEKGAAQTTRTKVTCLVGKGLGRAEAAPSPLPAPTPTPTPSQTPAERGPVASQTVTAAGTTMPTQPNQKHAIFDPAETYDAMDVECAGYFVNFEANIARIESRIARAMLTALPTDRARKFLEQLAGGNLLSALWSLAGASSDMAGAFHRGAGAYRAGLENVAASTPKCSNQEPGLARFETYRQERDTVRIAALCLGLSETDLFDDKTIEADELPNQVDPRAYLALFRIARTSCVALPLKNAPTDDAEFVETRKSRNRSCGLVRFDPKPRPDSIKLPAEDETPPETPSEPAPAPAPVSAPVPEPVPQGLPVVSPPNG